MGETGFRTAECRAGCPLEYACDKPIGQVRTGLQVLWWIAGTNEVDRVFVGDEALQVVGDGQVSTVCPARGLEPGGSIREW